MENEFKKLYDKVLSRYNGDERDLDHLLELIKADGYLCGRYVEKTLLREYYNVITGSTGLDENIPKQEKESSLLRRVREFINNKE